MDKRLKFIIFDMDDIEEIEEIVTPGGGLFRCC